MRARRFSSLNLFLSVLGTNGSTPEPPCDQTVCVQTCLCPSQHMSDFAYDDGEVGAEPTFSSSQQKFSRAQWPEE
jgi:hypothetical protein